MPGRGPAPKHQGRRRHNAPTRGDWIELTEPASDPEPLPEDHEWAPQTREAWDSWWADPASSQWSPSDRNLVLFLAELYELRIERSTIRLANEIRQVRDSLGLSPKGRQDRRWRIPQADVIDIADAPSAARDRMRAVDSSPPSRTAAASTPHPKGS